MIWFLSFETFDRVANLHLLLAIALPVLHDVDRALLGYSPVRLGPEMLERKGRLLARFIQLVYVEYKDGVRHGQISIPIEYQEARLFRDRSEVLFGELQSAMLSRSSEGAARIQTILNEMEAIMAAKGPAERLQTLAVEGRDAVLNILGIDAMVGGYQVALQLLPSVLDEVLLRVQQGDYAGAELKRMEGYAFFDPDIEQRLVPRKPSLSLRLEGLFWESSGGRRGLGVLLDQ